MKNKIIYCVIILFALIAVCAWGEPPQGPPDEPGQDTPAKKEEYRKKLHDRVFLMVAWELADEMDLPKDKEEKFLTTLREHFKQKSELVREQMEIMKSLKGSEAKNGKETQSSLKKLEDIRDSQRKLEDDLTGRLKDILSVEQQAKFVEAWPRVQEQIKQRLMERKERHKMQPEHIKGKGPKQTQQPDNPPPPPPK